MHRKHRLNSNITLQSLCRYVLLFISAFWFLCLPCNAQSAFYDLGKSYAKDGNYEEAICLTKLCLSTDEGSLNKLNMLLDYCALAEYFGSLQKSDSCEAYAAKALSLTGKVEGIEDEAILSNLSHSYLKAGLSDKAINARLRIKDLYAKKYGEYSIPLINQLRLISGFYLRIGDKANALNYAKQEEELGFKLRDEDSDFDQRIAYDDSFSYLLYTVQECESVFSGAPYLIDMLSLRKDAISKERRDHTLNAIWAMCRDANFSEGCYAVYKEEALNGTPEEMLTAIINLLAEDKNIQNDLKASIYPEYLYQICINDRASEYFDNENVAQLLYVLYSYYCQIGEFSKAHEMAYKNYLWRKAHGNDMFYQDIAVLTSSMTLKDLENKNLTKRVIEVGKDILESGCYSGDSESLDYVYECLGKAYLKLGEDDLSNFYFSKISSPIKRIEALADSHVLSGDTRGLQTLAPQLYAHLQQLDGMHRNNALLSIIIGARDARNWSLMDSVASSYVEAFRENLVCNLPTMSEDELTKFLQQGPFINTVSYDLFIGLDNDTIEWSRPMEAYNYTLLKKGLQLSSRTEFRNALKESKDSTIQEKYNRLLANSGRKGYSMDDEILKRELTQYAAKHSSLIKTLNYRWEDVKKALNNDELAIEYLLCYNFRTFSDKDCNPIFLALVLRKDMEIPAFVVCKNSDIIESLIQDNLELMSSSFAQALVSGALWEPITPYLDGIKTIYFFPDRDT